MKRDDLIKPALWVCVLFLIIVLLVKGGTWFTAWRVNHIKEIARAEATIREIEVAKAGPEVRHFTVFPDQSTPDLVELFKTKKGEYIDWVPENSPGVRFVATYNGRHYVPVEADTAKTETRGPILRIKVDPDHHAPGTEGHIRACKRSE